MRNSESTYCTRDQYLAPRVAFITWLVNFFLEKKYVNSATSSSKNGGEVLPKIIQVGGSLITKNHMDFHHLLYAASLSTGLRGHISFSLK